MVTSTGLADAAMTDALHVCCELTSTAPTVSPTSSPSKAPTTAPSSAPTLMPTLYPTAPTFVPTKQPTSYPTTYPTAPTLLPTLFPTAPTQPPTSSPSRFPTAMPSQMPTSPTVACPAGWTRGIWNNAWCYRAYQSSATFATAKTLCTSYHNQAKPVSVRDAGQAADVISSYCMLGTFASQMHTNMYRDPAAAVAKSSFISDGGYDISFLSTAAANSYWTTNEPDTAGKLVDCLFLLDLDS